MSLKKRINVAVWLSAVLSFGTVALGALVGTAFTYQGRLKDTGSPANGLYDMHFRLYDAATDGMQLGPVICYNNLNVVDGLFTATLDFGGQFAGQERFLETAIRVNTGENCANTSGFTTLSPRQKLTAAPNALFALNAGQLDGLDSTAFLQSIPVPLTLSGTSKTQIIMGENAAAEPGSSAIRGRSSTASGLTFGVIGVNDSTAGRGIAGQATSATGAAYGVQGASASSDGRGVYGTATAGSGSTYGGYFEAASTDAVGVLGLASATSGITTGVYGRSDSTAGRAVVGYAGATTGDTRGVYGLSESTSGRGVFGWAMASSGTNYGVYGQSDGELGCGVYGVATAAGGDATGGQFESATGDGVVGIGTRGGYFEGNSEWGRGVVGVSTAVDTLNPTYGGAFFAAGDHGVGVSGHATASSGLTYGVYGRSDSFNGTGVYGWARGDGGNYGGKFESDSMSGYGVYARANATTGTTYGGYFQSASTSGRGVYGRANATSGTIYGVYGQASTAAGGYAVYAAGDMGASGTKPFRIDHPDDPENKYLLHYAAESPEVINFYRGTVVLDDAGEAVVGLPQYFAKINKTPSYQLTAVGAPMPSLHVAEEISEAAMNTGAAAGVGVASPACTFRIAGGAPRAKVSWEVKAVRNDSWVRSRAVPARVVQDGRSIETRAMPVEVEKQGLEKGRYQHPEHYGQPGEKGMDYREDREVPPTADPGGTQQ